MICELQRLETVEAIMETKSLHSYSSEVFTSTKKLRLLEVKGQFTFTEPTHFPEGLRWLCWSEYPFQSENNKRYDQPCWPRIAIWSHETTPYRGKGKIFVNSSCFMYKSYLDNYLLQQTSSISVR